MHNLKDLRKNLDFLKKKFQDRNVNFNIDDFNKKDTLNRELINNKEKLEQEKKKFQNLKIKLILKNRKRFLKKFQF